MKKIPEVRSAAREPKIGEIWKFPGGFNKVVKILDLPITKKGIKKVKFIDLRDIGHPIDYTQNTSIDTFLKKYRFEREEN